MNFADRVKDSTTTTGSGSVTLTNNAQLGFRTFGNAFAVGTTLIPYCIADQGGANWETGYGTLVDAVTLQRDTVLASSNAGSPVSFIAGVKDVLVGFPAAAAGGRIGPSLSIPLNGNYVMDSTQVAAATTVTVVDTAASPFNSCIATFYSDGVTGHVVSVNNAVEHNSSNGYQNSAAGLENILTVFRAASGRNMFSWSQDAALSPISLLPIAPSFSVAPSITGTPIVGIATNYVPGTASGNPSPTLTQQWTLDGADIAGANGTTYTPISGDATHLLRVRQIATNASGSVNSTSNSATVQASATVPGAPTIGTATGGNASASVTFTAPASNGGAAITGYTVTSTPGSLTGSGASSPISVTGLTNGTSYTFVVKAQNPVGFGANSAASNAVTPVGSTDTLVYSSVFSTGTDSQALEAFTPASGTWSTQASSTGTGLTSATITPTAHRVRGSSAGTTPPGGSQMYTTGSIATPGSGGVFAEAVINPLDATSGLGVAVFLFGNNASAQNGIYALYGSTGVQLTKRIGGTNTVIAGPVSPQTAGTNFTLRLEGAAGAQRVLINGAQVLTGSEALDAGWGTQVGLRFSSASVNWTNTSGPQLVSTKYGTFV